MRIREFGGITLNLKNWLPACVGMTHEKKDMPLKKGMSFLIL